MALTAIACAAQQMPTGGTTPGSAEQGTPISGQPANPKENKPVPGDGLTFLPPLTATDGVVNLELPKNGQEQVTADASAMHEKPVLLDRAVAVINGEVIFASDVQEQQRFAAFEVLSSPTDKLSPMVAMRQIVNRTLLLDQMDEQEMTAPPSDAEVDKQIAELRQHLPSCAGQHCDTEEGWQQFLAAHGLTEAQLHDRWKQRMQILDFVGARFRTGIRITKPEIETYYKDKLLPIFESRKMAPPPLAEVSNRIEEVLLQQHVNDLLGDYLRSLKDAGSVIILDPQYNSLANSPATNANNSAAEMMAPGRHGGGEP